MNIPVTFQHEGKIIHAHLSPVTGAASSASFHLMEGTYYCGQLNYTSFGWQYYGNSYEAPGRGEELGSMVVSWVDSHGEL